MRHLKHKNLIKNTKKNNIIQFNDCVDLLETYIYIKY